MEDKQIAAENQGSDEKSARKVSFLPLIFLVPVAFFILLVIQASGAPEGTGMVFAVLAVYIFITGAVLIAIFVGYSALRNSFSSIKNFKKDNEASPGRRITAIINIFLGFSFLTLCAWTVMNYQQDVVGSMWWLLLGSFVIVFVKSVISLIISFQEKSAARERILPWIVVIVGGVIGIASLYNFFA